MINVTTNDSVAKNPTFLEWIEKHDFNPAEVSRVVVDKDNSEVTFILYVIREGQKYIEKDPRSPLYGQAVREARTVPLAAELPEVEEPDFYPSVISWGDTL